MMKQAAAEQKCKQCQKQGKAASFWTSKNGEVVEASFFGVDKPETRREIEQTLTWAVKRALEKEKH